MTPLPTAHARRHPRFVLVASLFAALMFLTMWLPRMAHAATIVVDTTDAGTVTNSECSLAEAILAANTNAAVDTCAAGDDTPVDTLVLGADLTYTLRVSYATYLEPIGLPSITSTIVISGNNATIVRDSSAQFGLLYVAESGDLTLHDLTLRNGHAITNGGALTNEGVLTLVNSAAISNAATNGGAIATISGTTSLSNTQVLSNAAKLYGGGLASWNSAVSVANSTVVSNSVTQFDLHSGGGGIYNEGSSLFITNTLVMSNTTYRYGSGIYSYDHSYTTVISSSILTNRGLNETFYSTLGGGIANSANSTLIVTDSILAGNQAGGPDSIYEFDNNGGGIFNSDHSTATVAGTRIANNFAINGAGIFNSGDPNHLNVMTISTSDILANYTLQGDPDLYRYGGGIFNGGAMTVTDSLVGENQSTRYGAGLYNAEGATLQVRDTQIVSNIGVIGGGLYNAEGATVQVWDTQLVSNTAHHGGGLYAYGPFQVIGSEILSNTVLGEYRSPGRGGGIFINANGLISATTVSANRNNRDTDSLSDGALFIFSRKSITMEITGSNISANDTSAIYIHEYDPFSDYEVALFITNTDIISNSGVGLQKLEDGHLSLYGSRLLNNRNGALVWEYGTGEIHQSCIVGNGDTAVKYIRQSGVDLIDATDNWWGTADGPSGVGPGMGDSVDSHTTFSPFLTSPILNCPTKILFEVDVTTDKSSALVGEVVRYTYRVTNTGEMTFTIMAANDDTTGAVGGLLGELAPGATHTATLDYVVQGSDLPTPLTNKVTVWATDSAYLIHSNTQSAQVTIGADNGVPDFSVTTTADRTQVALGGTILYTYRVQNQEITSITIDAAFDDHTGAIDELLGPLAPGATRTATRSYFVTPSDAPGPLVNSIMVTATDSKQNTFARNNQDSVEIVEPIIVASIVADRSYVALNGNILYTYRVQNQGVVPTTITGGFSDHTGQVNDIAGPLAPGSTRRATRYYKASQADLPGPILNTLIITGTDGVGNFFTSSATLPAYVSAGDGSPPLVVLLSTNKSFVKVGGTVVYTYRVINTGTSSFIISSAVDNRFGVISGLVGTLAAGETRTVTVSYVVEQDDEPGPIRNEVVVTVTHNGDSNVGSASATVNLGDFIQRLPTIYR